MTATTLGNAFRSISNGFNVPQDKSGEGRPVSRIETISNGTVDPNRVGYTVSAQDVPEKYLLKPGDILLSHINSPPQVGKCAMFRAEPRGLIHGINLLNLRCDERVLLPEYALHLLRSPTFLRSLRPFVNQAVNQASVSISNLKTIKVDLPPIDEQRKIATTLDKADQLRAKRSCALANLAALSESIFLEMFGDPASASTPFSMRKLNDVGQVITGNTPSRDHLDYFGDAIEWIKSDNIQPPLPYLTRAKEGLSDQGRQVARVAPAGSILVTCIAGSASSIGSAAIADRPVAFNQQINALVPHEGEALYFHALMTAGKRTVQAASTASMKGMINKSRFGLIELPVAPVGLQKEFAQRAALIHIQRCSMENSVRQLDDLFLSSQERAFKGDL